MKNATIPKSSFDFLKTLSKNNEREWFNTNKDRYLQELEHITNFADKLLAEMNLHDNIETAIGKKSLHRIYKDTRFSKDKTPYKNNWSGNFRRATEKLRGGYYFHIQPGNTFVAGGFFSPNPDDLKRIREDISWNYKEWRKIINAKKLKDTFGELEGEKVKSAPKGFSKDHPGIDLLRHKSFILSHSFSDKEVLSPGFLSDANKTFKTMRPFFDFMSELLTTDSNGVSLV